MHEEIGEVLADEVFQLMHAKAEILHRRFEELAEAIRLHQLHVNCERVFLRHLEEERGRGGGGGGSGRGDGGG